MHISTKGGIIIPNNDFITALLNFRDEEVELFESFMIENTVHYHVTLKLKNHDCPYCGGGTISHGKKKKTIHHPNIIDFNGVIHYYARRYICKLCRITFFETNPFTFENFNNSYAVIRRIMDHLSNLDMSFTRIAQLNHVSISTVILYLDSYVSIPQPSLPECLGIDELHSRMSAHDSAYLCVLIDNERRYPIDILKSRSKHNLNRYFETYPKNSRDKVKYVTIDMWQPYKDVALRQFNNCKIAVDPFHVVRHLCNAFSKVRLNIMNQSPYGSNTYYLLKKFHFLLEVSDINLDNEAQYNSRFKRKLNFRQIQNMIFEISDKLFDAYHLKCTYQFFNDNATFDNCEAWLDKLIYNFQSSYISEYRDFSALLVNWRVEIINSFLRPYGDRKLSNALAENINGKIRTYISLSNGFQNFNRFRKRVLLALNPKIFYSISSKTSSDKIPRTYSNNTTF